MNRMQSKVALFYQAMGVRCSEEPALVNREVVNLLVQEESQQLQEAVDEGDFLKAIDALGDLQYVCFGAAVQWGLDMEPFFDEIHRANMRKQRDSWELATGRVTKPAEWVPPDLAPILERQQLGRAPLPLALELTNPMQGMELLERQFDLEALAKVAHDTWAEYARETMTRPPAAFVKGWEETGDWGKEANRRTAQALLQAILSAVLRRCSEEVPGAISEG